LVTQLEVKFPLLFPNPSKALISSSLLSVVQVRKGDSLLGGASQEAISSLAGLSGEEGCFPAWRGLVGSGPSLTCGGAKLERELNDGKIFVLI
jgi:hypothetical protein